MIDRLYNFINSINSSEFHNWNEGNFILRIRIFSCLMSSRLRSNGHFNKNLKFKDMVI